LAAVLSPDPAFWRGRRVFLTGHTGFKGAWLAIWLHRMGAEVRGFALAPDQPGSLCEAAGVEAAIDSVRGDIRDPTALHAALAGWAPDTVLHLAAQALVQRSYHEPVETYATNVMGTIHLMEAVRRTLSVRAAVIVTTDKVYENREWVWPYREDEALGGFDPYSSSKACTEMAVAAWRRCFLGPGGTAVATARAGNVIGGGDQAENRLIPDCIRALAAGETIRIRNPAATRPWQHVLEPLSGYLTLAERLHTQGADVAEAWNFGPAMDDVAPVSAVVDHVTRLWGDGARWERVETNAGHEAGLLAVDAAKARARLGWAPRLRLTEALDWTVGWYRRHARGEAARGLVLHDIERYEETGVAFP
jgi:CDP-glucose 4,6-dehydratase